MKKYKIIICIILPLLSVISCFKNTWSGFYYPNKNDLTVDEFVGDFSTLEDCRQAIHAIINSTNNQNADYECGLNCDRLKGKPYICEKTEK
ncbi:MAG: hypothetical protein K0R98_1389 [Rickettsiaceae bacterium]|jgi:hypothetical protein|nr:hypothetical protein [Rickettsiaceae bacterium]